jgi:hypothetical protein
MALRKEVVSRMKEAGFLKSEIDQLNDARKPDGEKQELDLIVNSATFEHALQTRRDWWTNALKPKALGGSGLTLKDAKKVLEGFYVKKRGRKFKRDFWLFLKQSYRPRDKITSKKKFQEAITAKSLIGKTLGKYGPKLKARYNPHLRRCSHCRGSGTLRNLYGQNQNCIYCSGTGVERQRFI